MNQSRSRQHHGHTNSFICIYNMVVRIKQLANGKSYATVNWFESRFTIMLYTYIVFIKQLNVGRYDHGVWNVQHFMLLVNVFSSSFSSKHIKVVKNSILVQLLIIQLFILFVIPINIPLVAEYTSVNRTPLPSIIY